MYRYETHLHTAPISKCAVATMEETLRFYKAMDYDGVFITEHFLDGNTTVDKNLPWEEQIDRYFSSYEQGLELSNEIGLKIFPAVEMSYNGTDFLIYGLYKEWYKAHPEIMTMKKSAELTFLAQNGALIIQAHPFRNIDHIRLFPNFIHGTEIVNTGRTDFENSMAKIYADSYNLIEFAGSDNHNAAKKKYLAGMESKTPINSVEEFIQGVRNKSITPFTLENHLCENKE